MEAEERPHLLFNSLPESDALSTGYDSLATYQCEKTIERNAEAFRLLVDGVIDYAIFILDPDGRVVTWNAGAQRIKGYQAAEIIGKHLSVFYTKEACEQGWPEHELTVARTVGRFEDEGWRIRKDGSRFWANVIITALRDSSGELLGFSKITRDISVRRQAEVAVRAANADLEEQVRHRTKQLDQSIEELARSNLDLEQFAYVASHDLQEPLRAIAGGVQVLKKRYQGQMDPRADELISHIVDGATRMQTLINDLLSYSRVGTRGKEFEPIACDAILDRALANLGVAIAESGTVVTRDLLPVLKVDAAQFTQVFQNLIGNAIKFRSHEPPQIHVGAYRENGRWIITIQDNGIGIDPEYFQRIFIIFQRLHTRTEYPGTGIGLAICKKIVERHDGQISVQSALGQGAKFNISLPE